MQLTHLLLLTGSVIGVVAHPSGHAHAHAHLHRSAALEERAPPPRKHFVKNVRPKLKALKTSSTASSSTSAAPTAAPTVAAPSAAPVAPSAPSAGKYIPFCSEGKGASKAKRVTVAQVHYTGNTGTAAGCDWNSNIMLVPNDIANLYTYKQKYTNVASEPYEVVCFNKIGPTGGLTGMFEVKEQKPLRFMLGPGEVKTVVTQEDTQAVCAFSPNKIQKTPLGQFAGNWAETDSGNRSNGKWSGADCSSLVAQHYDMDVPGCKICSNDTGNECSIIKPGGIGINAYTKGMEELDGIGLNIPAGSYTMEIAVGYS
ncbi:hypothetical protein QBC39DRAFT_310023 [Podospora conica]|nr:hypothetical protein QBC39DRAFT_310023 [Schizothecium conicum]